jgi:hypothetical protein
LDTLREIATGRLGKSIHEFYSMQLIELNNAIDGFEKLRKEDHLLYLEGCRRVSFWAFKGWAGKKLRKYEQIFELETDVKARKQRLKGVKPSQIIKDGK